MQLTRGVAVAYRSLVVVAVHVLQLWLARLELDAQVAARVALELVDVVVVVRDEGVAGARQELVVALVVVPAVAVVDRDPSVHVRVAVQVRLGCRENEN